MSRLAIGARIRWMVAALTLVATLPAMADEAGPRVEEPSGLWTGPLAGDTPATMQGAVVIGVAELDKLMADKPLLIDVGPADRKPDNLPASAIWKPVHRSIPGAIWFPGAGRGDLPQDKVDVLLRRIDELANGNKDTLVVTFCQPRCWGSWNVGKRLVEAGYASVHWLPAGVAGWQEDHPTSIVPPEPGWEPKPPAK